MMEKFKVKKKHITGEIADFPKRVVQAMVDEQVRQGNPADPSVFAGNRIANKEEGGFTWIKVTQGYSWSEIILYKKFHLIPKRDTSTEATPHEIIQHMLYKGMAVWVCVSDNSYDDARANIGRSAYRVTRYSTDSFYPVQTWCTIWKYAVPVDIATMTEITKAPK